MATIDIKLTNAFADAALTEAQLADISIGSQTLEQLKAAGTSVTLSGKTVTVAGYGVFSVTGANALTFTANAALAAGTYTFTNAAAGKFTKIDLTSATAAINATASDTTTAVLGGAGADTLVGGAVTTSIEGAAGNDSLKAGDAVDATLKGGEGNDTLNAGGTAARTHSLVGGTGADVFQTTGASVVASDYSYTEGDVIKATVGTTTLSDAGALSVNGGVVTGTVAIADNAYKAKITEGTTTTEYWTAVSNRAVKLDGSAVTNGIVMDAANNAEANTLIGGAGKDSITTGAGADIVWGGAGDDKITLSTDTTQVADTVWFGSGNGNDAVSGFVNGITATDDVVNLYNATLSDARVYADGTNTLIRVGDSTLTLDVDGSVTDIDLKVQEKDGTVKKVAFDLVAGGNQDFVVTNTLEADVFYGNNSNLDYSGYSKGSSLKVDLYTDTAKYKGIDSIKASASLAGTYIGSATAATTIDASGATKANAIWGGSANADVVSLNDTARDTVWFGAADGKDSISGSSYGYADTADVIKLWDVTDLTKVTFSNDATGVTITDGTAVLTTGLAATAGTGANILVEDAAGTIKKVAFSRNKTEAATINGATADGVADYVQGTKDYDDTANYDALTVDKLINLQDAAVYNSIESIDASAATGNLTLIGAAGEESAIQAGTKNNAIWAGSSEDNAITLNAAGGATNVDTVWYSGAQDGKDTVTNFKVADDVVKFWDMSIAELAASDVEISTAGPTTTFTFDTDNVLSLDISGKNSINIKDETDAAAVIQVGDAAAPTFTYDDKTKIYFGTATTDAVVLGEASATLYLDNGKTTAQFGKITVNDIYLNDVTELDASGKHGDYTLVGSATVANTLKGGAGTTAMWGGGLSNTAMQGGTGVDSVWFGSGDGIDTFTQAGSSDKVVLWNAASISDLTATYNSTTNTLTIATKTGDQLSIVAAAADSFAGLAFQVGTSNTAAKYTYDTATESFKAKA